MSSSTAKERLQKLAARLQAAQQCRQIYPAEHPRLNQAVEELHADLLDMFASEETLRIAYADREFILDAQQIPAEGEILLEFGTLLEAFGVERVIFESGVTVDEMRELVELLTRSPEQLELQGGIEEAIERSGIERIELGLINIDSGDDSSAENLFRTWEAYSTGLRIMRGLKQMARERGELAEPEDVRELAFELTSLAAQEARPLLAVHSLMQHDEYSFTHSLNVAMLTLALAQNLPFEARDLREITVAALLHDIGKERIPGDLLRKPGKLTDEEREIMNSHGIEGARMLAESEAYGTLAPLVAYEHHLSHEPSAREEGWAPHLVSQMVAIVDVYDALRSIRPYRGPIPPDKALTIMEEEAPTKFEPSLFAGFRAMVGRYPPGTVVRLESGRLAVSFATNPQTPDLPQVVTITRGAAGVPAAGESVNLAEPSVADRVLETVNGADFGIEPLNFL